MEKNEGMTWGEKMQTRGRRWTPQGVPKKNVLFSFSFLFRFLYPPIEKMNIGNRWNTIDES